jgi:transcription elongation factor GreB
MHYNYGMSRAFVSESDASDEPDLPPLKIPLPPGARNYMTPPGAEKLGKEISELRKNDRSELSARVSGLIAAGAQISLTELRTAQQDLAALDRQLNYLEELMRTAEVVTRPPGPAEKVMFGMTVSVRAVSDREKTNYTIVGIYESNPEEGLISWVSPIAKALKGKRVGDAVEIILPTSRRELEVLSIRQI